MNRKQIDQSFQALSAYAVSLTNHPIHATLMVRRIDLCKAEILAAVSPEKEEDSGDLSRS